ncbi:Meckel syndrome type 1 protein (mks1) [Trypanosoma cruzi cruzi]|uniref:Putative Meckel syndrome type 1 protein n=1 Tax=Trypanosoma cruzi TaxID=5693 RepID=A0A2V2ULF0_TRYCR|nr:Meckel syndrome type 1 protein (mks1) [Trypanosoma cruzi cruzi]PWU84046.1 putative Meckel syndrome type 1 protein [Trypanosoma cruzi]
MDFFRFHSAQQYSSQVPLRKLLFCVTLWRALLVEENQPEVLCSVTVPWDGKLFSPAEKLDMIRAVAAETAAGINERVSLRDDADGTEMEIMHALLQGRASPIPDAVSAAKQLKEHLEKSASALFTHTSSEDYICETEEECPVVPPQDPSPLASAVLRRYRTQHKTSNKMYFMWAIGGIPAPRGASLTDMRWEGEERVICIITADKSEFYFTARPSINEMHTLFVDSLHVYSFKISVTAAKEKALTPSETDGIIQKIWKIALRVKEHLYVPHSGRRQLLQQMLLQDAAGTDADEVALEVEPASLTGGRDSFTQGRSRGKVRHYIHGTIDRCVGVAEDALYLHCQWQQGTRDGDSYETGNVDESFTTQLAFAGTAIVEDFILVPVHTFNTPFEYHLDDVEMKPLELIVTVYSETERSQQAPVGYTTMTVPYMLPGCHSLRAPLWRPHQTGREFLRSALVGGAPSLVDSSDVAARSNTGMSLRHGLVTEPSGEVEARVIVLHHHSMPE